MDRLVGLALACVLVACGGDSSQTEATVTFEPSGASFQVAIADEVSEQARGLMGVSELADDEGMLFLWDEVSERTFWMKDTLIPLDLISIADGAVVGITTMEPCRADPCPRTTTPPADMALEVNAGVAAAAGIGIGEAASLT